jgi:hypothetical protein
LRVQTWFAQQALGHAERHAIRMNTREFHNGHLSANAFAGSWDVIATQVFANS